MRTKIYELETPPAQVWGLSSCNYWCDVVVDDKAEGNGPPLTSAPVICTCRRNLDIIRWPLLPLLIRADHFTPPEHPASTHRRCIDASLNFVLASPILVYLLPWVTLAINFPQPCLRLWLQVFATVSSNHTTARRYHLHLLYQELLLRSSLNRLALSCAEKELLASWTCCSR